MTKQNPSWDDSIPPIRTLAAWACASEWQAKSNPWKSLGLPALSRNLGFGLALGLATITCHAATDLADSPIPVALNASQVQPNIMFTLDDSGSMQFEVMPENDWVYFSYPRPATVYGAAWGYGNSYSQVAKFDFATNKYARYYRTAKFNLMYYNPTKRYLPWIKADGTSFPSASMTGGANTFHPNNAPNNPFVAGEGTRDLTANNTQTANWTNDDGTWTNGSYPFYPATYYVWNGAGTLTGPTDVNNIPGNFLQKEIKSANAPFTGSVNRTDCVIPLACTYNEEMQNFANWYTYYRSRILASRAGIGKAFDQVGSNVRVGFAAINEGVHTIDGVASNGTLVKGVRKFSGANRQAWFDELYGHVMPSLGTPLRNALDDVGRYFMRTDSEGPWGANPGASPADTSAQLTCRQSNNILMTDGYWTGGAAYAASVATGNVDNTDGLVITNPNPPPPPASATYQYTPVAPYMDANSDTLADVAMYYWKNDLRTDLSNEVPPNNADLAFWQHLVTFTVGLGVTGTLNYPTDLGTSWPNPTTDPTKIDDLWHAAVNGHGAFFSAADPDAFANSLIDALNDIAGRNNGFAANAVSNPNISATDNVTFGTSYNPAEWSGEISAYSIDVTTGVIGTTTLWSPGAQALLDAKTFPGSDSRKIVTYSGSAGVPFQWDNLTASQKTQLNSDIRVLQFLRGWRGNEGTLYRKRQHVLGDMVNAEGVVVSTADYHYTDSGYSSFAASGAPATRLKTLYQGANDGMLHAFDATTGLSNSGKELWAYVPNLLMGTLSNLSTKVGFTHKYYVDGTPVIGDVDFKNTDGGTGAVSWHTILVGGLGKGGSGYYALDVTSQIDPATATEPDVAAKAMWEFTDPNMGYTYGKPVITKTRAGKWVVLVTSGYNNVPAAKGGPAGSLTGDGKGHLYVLNAKTGELIKDMKITADSGSPDSPSGFAQIAGFVENTDLDNTVDVVYGGDLNGDVWRFDLSGSTTDSWSVSKLATQSQPVTTVPETAWVTYAGVPRRMVYIGTGQYLGISDVTTNQTQSMYGIKDAGILARNNGNTAAPAATINLRGGTLVQQTLAAAGSTRTVTPHDVNLTTGNGWYVDLPSIERANTDPILAYGVLVFTTNVPDSSPCSIYGGSSWLNYLDFATGGSIHLSNGTWATASVPLGRTLASRAIVIVAGGKPYVIGTKTDDTRFKFDLPLPGSSRRVSWRELVTP